MLKFKLVPFMRIVFIITLIGLPFLCDLHKLFSNNCGKNQIRDSKTEKSKDTQKMKINKIIK